MEYVSPLLNVTGHLVTGNMEKSEILNTFFTSVFIDKTDLQESGAHGTTRKVWSTEDSVGEDQGMQTGQIQVHGS